MNIACHAVSELGILFWLELIYCYKHVRQAINNADVDSMLNVDT